MATTGPVIYKEWGDTYLDPEHLPSKKNLVIRGVLDCLPWLLPFGLCGLTTAVPLGRISTVLMLAGMGFILVGVVAWIHATTSKANKRDFIAVGGDTANYGYWSYAGMRPMGQTRGAQYRFATPEDLNRLKTSPYAKLSTRDRVFF